MSTAAPRIRGFDAPRAPERFDAARRASRLRRFLLVIGTLGFVALAVAARQGPPLPGDLEIARAVQTVDGPWIHAPLWALSAIGFPPIVGVLYAAIAASLFVAGARREGIFAAIATSGAAALHRGVVEIIQRPRPSPELLEVAHQLPIHGGFTAGHVQNATSFFGFLVYLAVVRLAPSWKRTLLLHALVFAIVGMGVCRVYFGEHWPTDVLGGYLLGVLWLVVVIEGYERWQERSGRRPEFRSE